MLKLLFMIGVGKKQIAFCSNNVIISARSSSGATETKQWSDMIANPKQPVTVWHRSVSIRCMLPKIIEQGRPV